MYTFPQQACDPLDQSQHCRLRRDNWQLQYYILGFPLYAGPTVHRVGDLVIVVDWV